jgi:protein-S-isoprenylcysteine O-methyltransferase Ste14
MKNYSTAQMKKFRLFWRIVFIAGFILILVNALAYLTGWNKISSSTVAIGIIFVALGIIFGQMKK